VGNNIDSVSAVRGVNADSWKYKRLDFVALTFQISEHLFEDQSVRPIKESTNILPHDIPWSDFSDCTEHFRPKMAFIFFSHPFSSGTEGLARKSTGEDIDFSSPNSKVSCLDVVIRFGLWPIKTTHFSTKRVDVAMELILPSHPLSC
jgi:hypothetical protein